MDVFHRQDSSSSHEGKPVSGKKSRGRQTFSHELSDEIFPPGNSNYEKSMMDGNGYEKENNIAFDNKKYSSFDVDSGGMDFVEERGTNCGTYSKNLRVNMNDKRCFEDNGMSDLITTEEQKLRRRHADNTDSDVNASAYVRHGDKRDRPGVVVTEAQVHSSIDELEEDEKSEFDDHTNGNETENHEGQDDWSDKMLERETVGSKPIRKKYQSHQNLSHYGRSEEDRKRSRLKDHKRTSHHYTPELVRKGTEYTYEIPIDEPIEDGIGDLISSKNFSHHGNRDRCVTPIQKTSSLADVANAELNMPLNKMGSFQDFRPLKHSPSTTRVSSSKGRI